jgi:membrane-associated phospholipid phosphatase
MTYRSPHERRRYLRRTLTLLLFLALSLLILTLLDRPLWKLLLIDPEKTLERKDWWQLLRQYGSILTWLIIGVCLILLDASRARNATNSTLRAGTWHRGLMVILATAIAGGLAELLKTLSGRARPLETGEYRFKWLEPDVHLPGGLASSHAAVAFAGAIMLGWFVPAWRVPLLGLAYGCALTRLAVGAHFVTDVYVGVLLAWGTCALLWRLFSANPGGTHHPWASWLHLHRDSNTPRV